MSEKLACNHAWVKRVDVDRYEWPLTPIARVMDGIRKAIGDDFVLEWHLSGSELTPGGLEIEDTIEIAKLLQDKIDMIHITCDSRSNAVTKAAMHPSHFIEHGHNASRAEAVKRRSLRFLLL